MPLTGAMLLLPVPGAAQPASPAALGNLDLADNRVVDVSALQDLPRLRHLHLGGNPVADLSPLGDVGALVWLGLPGDVVSADDAFGRLTGLRWVWSAGTFDARQDTEAP